MKCPVPGFHPVCYAKRQPFRPSVLHSHTTTARFGAPAPTTHPPHFSVAASAAPEGWTRQAPAARARIHPVLLPFPPCMNHNMNHNALSLAPRTCPSLPCLSPPTAFTVRVGLLCFVWFVPCRLRVCVARGVAATTTLFAPA